MRLAVLTLAAAAAAVSVARDVGAGGFNNNNHKQPRQHELSSNRPHPKNGRHRGSSFSSYFSSGVDSERFSFADNYANGQPFNTGWSAHNHHVTNGYLSLDLRRDTFTDPGSATGSRATYPYTSGELRSRAFHGTGCYTVCMKPARVSGVTSSFYIHSGPHDVVNGFWDKNPVHNEIGLSSPYPPIPSPPITPPISL